MLHTFNNYVTCVTELRISPLNQLSQQVFKALTEHSIIAAHSKCLYSRRHNKVSVPFLLPFRFLVVLPFLLPFVTVYNRSVFSGVTVFVTV